jgi:hypothetical protein
MLTTAGEHSSTIFAIGLPVIGSFAPPDAANAEHAAKTSATTNANPVTIFFTFILNTSVYYFLVNFDNDYNRDDIEHNTVNIQFID